jgi:hypothetical protein
MASPGLDNLHIIEAGPIPSNPSELLSTAAMRDFLQAVSAEYDIVLIDTPPILPVTDSAIVAGQVDGVLLVYQAGKVGRLVLKRAKAHLESARAKVWGIVLNDLQTEVSGYTYTHYYTHYYGEESGGDAPRGRTHRVLGFLGSLRGKLGFGGGGTSAPAVTPGSATAAAPAVATAPAPATDVTRSEDVASVAPWRRRLPSKRVVGVGILVASVLAGGIIAWLIGLPGIGMPRAQLRQRLDSPPSRPGQAPNVPSRPSPSARPASTAAPVTTIRPSAPPAVIVPPLTAPSAVRPLIDTLPLPTPPPASAPTPAVTPPAPAVNAPLLAMTPPAPSAPPAAPARDTTRFAVMFGPFSSAVEAQRVERTLIKAGHDALRARQEAGPTMYAVLIERISTAQDARTIMSVLREQAIGEAAIVSTEPVIVRVGDVHPLRGAVALAERVRKAGYRVRVAAQSGGKATYVIRHGSFATREEAEARSRELARLSVPAAQVVPVP